MKRKCVILLMMFGLLTSIFGGDDPDEPWQLFAELTYNNQTYGRMSDMVINFPDMGGTLLPNGHYLLRYWQGSTPIRVVFRSTDIHYPGGIDGDVWVRFNPFNLMGTGSGQTHSWTMRSRGTKGSKRMSVRGLPPVILSRWRNCQFITKYPVLHRIELHE